MTPDQIKYFYFDGDTKPVGFKTTNKDNQSYLYDITVLDSYPKAVLVNKGTEYRLYYNKTHKVFIGAVFKGGGKAILMAMEDK